MILKLMDFLSNQQFIEMVEWANEVSHKKASTVDKNDREILSLIAHKQMDPLIELLRKICYSTVKNETYTLILKQFEQNLENIRLQWTFSDQIEKDKSFINIILNKNILILQPSKEAPANLFNSLKGLENTLSNPNLVVIGGQVYELKALSSIDKLQAILKESNVTKELSKFKKYERIIAFIEALELPLQELFSFHQIGIIIYENDVYLVKWIQYLDEQQILTGKKSVQKTEVSMLEEFGVTIGIQLKESLELGNLVIFSDTSKTKEKMQLKPLLSLNESIFAGGAQKKAPKKWDLTKKESCREFVDDVLARIETGIMLIDINRPAALGDVKDLDLYIKISLQKVEAIESTNQRINLLRDLLSVNKNPDTFAEIVSKLENCYINFLKEQMQYHNAEGIPYLLKTFGELKLFRETYSLLVHTLVYLIETYSAEPEIILKIVDMLYKNWTMTPDLMQLLEKPQIIAITSNVANRLNQGQFSEVMGYLSDYLQKHPYFRSYSMINLMIQIIVNIFKSFSRTSSQIFDVEKFLLFIKEFIKLLHNSERQLSETDIKSISEAIDDNFILISQDVDFIAYLNDKLLDFISLLETIKIKFLRKKIIMTITDNIFRLAPVVMFQRGLPEIGWQTYHFLIKQKNDDSILQFFMQFINVFTHSYPILQKNTTLFQEAAKILEKIRKYIEEMHVPKPFFLPIKKEVLILFNTWYLSGNLPENDFEIHKWIISMWVDFVDYRSKFTDMINILFIKDLLWACNNGDINLVKQKYQELPPSVFEANRPEITAEMQAISKRLFATIKQFEVNHFIFKRLIADYQKIGLTPPVFSQLAMEFSDNFFASVLDIVQQGDQDRFEKIVAELGEDIIFLSVTYLRRLFENLTEVYKFETNEGERFIARNAMMGVFSLSIERFLARYAKFSAEIVPLVANPGQIASKTELEQMVKQLKEGGYKIFRKTQEWLMQMCEENYCTAEMVFKPAKTIFQNIILQFSERGANNNIIIQDLLTLIESFFYNQKMLNDNKKQFFKIILELLPDAKYPMFYPQLKEHKDFVDELTELEALYYTIKDRVADRDKINNVLQRSFKMIEKCPNFFNPWFYYGNTLAILERYNEAMAAYLEAMKYDSTRGNYARLIHNLLVCYLTLKQYDQAVLLIKNIDVGLKTYPHISQLIRQVEQLTGQHLLA